MIATNIEVISHIRNRYLDLFNELSNEQLNRVPAGFNNNILWNLGHLLVTDELMFYKAAGKPSNLDEAFMARFRRGTKPEGVLSDEDTALIKQELAAALPRVTELYKAGHFDGYTPVTLSNGLLINDLGGTLAFSAYHHGLHSAAIGNLKKALL